MSVSKNGEDLYSREIVSREFSVLQRYCVGDVGAGHQNGKYLSSLILLVIERTNNGES